MIFICIFALYTGQILQFLIQSDIRNKLFGKFDFIRIQQLLTELFAVEYGSFFVFMSVLYILMVYF